jgi:hypothetical protein
MPRYVLDTNVFIQAKNTYYGMDFCPAFWNFLQINIENHNFVVIDSVYEEIKKGKDDLFEWIKRFGKLVRKSHDVQDECKQISALVTENKRYGPEEKEKFLGKADPFIIATAMKIGGIVVTHEVSAPEDSTKIKIPNICKHNRVNVEYMNTFKMIIDLKGKFILERHSTTLFS